MESLTILFAALFIDLVLGELPRFIHPVVGIGKLASFLEKRSVGDSHAIQFGYGMAITLFLIGLFGASTYLVLSYLKDFNPVLYVLTGAVLLKSAFSLRALRQAALRVKKLLLSENLDVARYELRALVSRDTQALPQPLLISATIESVAENTCDSFVAPLFYFLLFGVPGAVAYRVVNTLDAIIGYHGKYEYSGKFAAKLDDVLNFTPARLTALLLVSASFLSRRNARASWQVAFREHTRTESPNAGWTMAAMAGALNVQLEKVGHYRLGNADTPLVTSTIDAALRLMQIAALIWVTVCLITGGVRFAITSST
ncbi:MAG: cobalamin biosynthesis protein [Dehalococcoidales bacterium]|nr:cobalamin biosynthesis protein [Dehalococcoidales bacterium]